MPRSKKNDVAPSDISETPGQKVTGARARQRAKRPSAGEWRPAFLTNLRNSANIRAACEVAGISRKTAYQHREQSKEFREEWDFAVEDGLDLLEGVAQTRAVDSSDRLLEFLLKSRRYRDEPVSVNVGGGSVQNNLAVVESIKVELSDPGKVASIAGILAEAGVNFIDGSTNGPIAVVEPTEPKVD